MAGFSTYEALKTLCTSIPEWNERLDDLNGQISLRQIELARLTEVERPPTRSIKNKGSTESLRPKDGDDNPFAPHEGEKQEEIQMNPFDTPNSQRPISSTAANARGAIKTPPALKTAGALARQPSQPTHSKAHGAAARKRKTESLASGESVAPKYRTRSMIIVYYDSAVQQAFEDLVKFVSASRNAMRKGKMNAKMEEMKRAAELELEADEDDEDGGDLPDLVTNSGNLLAAEKRVSVNKEGASVPTAGGIAVGDAEADMGIPRLKFVSTRQMGPNRGDAKLDNFGSTLSVGMLRGYRRSGGGPPDIFDAVDKGLEWVQGQCEHAAHQFLRDGDCSTEIANIKKRLVEVKKTAGAEVEKLKAEGADQPPLPPKAKQLKSPVQRREFNTSKDLEVDMEVDDEGVDDLEPPQLIFKRSRDIGR